MIEVFSRFACFCRPVDGLPGADLLSAVLLSFSMLKPLVSIQVEKMSYLTLQKFLFNYKPNLTKSVEMPLLETTKG